jgi:hypothetical protein
MNTANWMKDLPDTKWLRQIVMPGSHDAGVYGNTQTIIRASALVKAAYTAARSGLGRADAGERDLARLRHGGHLLEDHPPQPRMRLTALTTTAPRPMCPR